jgi:hypothetical protein
VVVLRWTVRGSHVKLEVGVDGPPVCVNVLGGLLVGGGEAVVEARKRHDNVSSDCMHYLLRCLELCSHSTYDLIYYMLMTWWMMLSVAASTLVLGLWLILMVSCTNLPSSFSSHSRMDSMKRVMVRGGLVLALPITSNCWTICLLS